MSNLKKKVKFEYLLNEMNRRKPNLNICLAPVNEENKRKSNLFIHYV